MADGAVGSRTSSALDRLILADQFDAVRRSLRIAIAVNILLGSACTVVAVRAGHGGDALAWLAASTAINLLRLSLCRPPPLTAAGRCGKAIGREAAEIERYLRLAWIMALLSGLAWSAVPALCDGYTSPQTLFFLTVVCGATAGAVTHGTAYSRIPIAFITPPLVSAFGFLIVTGDFDRVCLSATVLLYLGALTRSSQQSEAVFREASRLKNEATTLARSLEEANARSSELAEQMGRRATHDPLTGLRNRAGFMQEAETLIASSDRPHCLMLLDLDGFKSVNDTFGHKAGDRVLQAVARRLEGALPSDAVVARLGGDEFAVFYESRRSSEAPTELAVRLVACVARPFEAFDAGRLGASIGVHDVAGGDVADMLVCADEALYAAKSAGRGRVRVFDDGLRNRLAMRRDTERDLARALPERALEVWFQPIFGRAGSELAGLEALVRWNHPLHGWIPPPDLISTAAMAGLSEPLLRFILGEVCAMIRSLQVLDLGDVRVAMNVSPREMSQIAVDEIVLGMLEAQGIPPSALEIEITEETALDLRAVQGKLAALSRAGIRLAIDDFGVGYSSLASLRQLKADRVKIDRSFVTGIALSEDARTLVQAVLGLARSMRFDVVAEGVETEDDLVTLTSMGCPYLQGYHLGRPMPPHAVRDWLGRSHATAA